MSKKLFIVSGLDDSNPLSELKPITIDFGDDHKKCLLFDPNGSRFFECVKQTNEFQSFFVDNTVVADGNLYVCTPFDVTFVVLPFLIKKKKYFNSLFDVLSDIFDKQICLKLEKAITAELIGSIADFKNEGEDLYIRYNSDKTLEWLKSKTDKTVEALIKNKINVSSGGCKVSGFTTGNEDSEKEKAEYTRIAFELISQYLYNDEIKIDLKNLLRISDESSESSVSFTQIKRKLNDSTSSLPLEDYSTYVCGTNGSKVEAKKAKLTRSQKELLKVDKTGMKSISSFFKPKQK